MVFLVVVSMIPCLTQRLSPESRKKLKEYYRTAKKYCIRGLFGMVGGTGGYTLLKEAAKDGIKRYIGGILVNSGLTCVSGGIFFLTNATIVVKYSKACHSVCAARKSQYR
jgi:hypothetical protein